MSAYFDRETRLYKLILSLLVVLAVVTVSGCLGLLWLRQKIELTAQATRELETEIVKEERRLRYLDTKVAEIHQPIYLERQIERLGLRLQPPMENQVVYVDGPPLDGSRYVRQPERERPATDAWRRSMDLAFMDALNPGN
jgi:hypothetical protein